MRLSEANKILITGGAGLIGSHIADQLVRADPGREIVVIDNFTRGRRENLAWALEHGNISLVEGDIRDRALLAEELQDVDVLFHQAAIRITQCAQEPRLALEVMADGTFNVLEAAVDQRVKKIVAASSASVYGQADEFPTPESHPPYNNQTFYGATKIFNEGLLRSFHDMYGLEYVALRYFNVYGPRMDIHGAYTEVMIRWMERIEAGQPPLIFGDGTQTMDFVYVGDVARANLAAVESSASHDAFNVASGTETSLDEVANLLIEVMGSNLKPEYGPARKVNAVERRLADIRQAEKALDFRTEVDLRQGLANLVEWWRSEQRV